MADVLQRAAQSHRAGRLDEAEHLYRELLAEASDHFDSLHALGVIAAQRRDFSRAQALLQRALAINPHVADAQANQANVQNALGRYEDALASAERALQIDPRHVVALYNRAVALQRLKRYDEAIADYDAALAIMPEFAQALTNRGAALHDLNRYDEALASLDQALAIQPSHVEALYNRGLALQHLQRYREAIASYDRALALRPDLTEALNNRGLCLQSLQRYDEARASYDEALAHRSDFAEARFNRGAASSAMGRHENASQDIERALTQNPDLPHAAGALLHARMYACDWRSYENESADLLAKVRAGRRAAEPLTILNICDSAPLQLACARTYIDDRFPAAAVPLWRGERYAHDRIRIAYLSADFHDHAVMHLMAGLFEQHDRAQFDVVAVSFGPDPSTDMRARLKGAFERFIDVRHLRDDEIAKILRDLETDIAIDLKGFTDDARTGIFAFRPAPIQVNYLGYPGTMGAPYIDYIIVDPIVVPHDQRLAYAEKVVYLPHCYQVNDAKRLIAERTPTRSEAALPETGFVFCSFNNNYKVTPTMFDVWMSLLRDIDGSVLWLFEGNAAAPANLRREAANRGVAPERLVFAPKVPLADHLARHRLADLFLDTQPWNAHTTASDALWAGLPLLTCIGTTFAGRVAASLLEAVGLPDLVTRTLSEYQTLALQLAREPSLLAGIKQRLSDNREVFPLFNTDRSRRHIEAAYSEMYARQRRGEAPASFAIAPLA
jgi:predicted O-linked N-acetylglucosamine transferase (SPINDLY family)